MAESRFGVLYTITRLLLVILILVLIITNIIQLARNHGKTEDIVWVVFSFISMIIGLIGVWREHFLFSCLFAIIAFILACVGGAYGIWASTTGTIIIIITAIIYTFMLWDMGNRDMNMPNMC